MRQMSLAMDYHSAMPEFLERLMWTVFAYVYSKTNTRANLVFARNKKGLLTGT
jgi:hypothetical protein